MAWSIESRFRCFGGQAFDGVYRSYTTVYCSEDPHINMWCLYRRLNSLGVRDVAHNLDNLTTSAVGPCCTPQPMLQIDATPLILRHASLRTPVSIHRSAGAATNPPTTQPTESPIRATWLAPGTLIRFAAVSTPCLCGNSLKGTQPTTAGRTTHFPPHTPDTGADPEEDYALTSNNLLLFVW